MRKLVKCHLKINFFELISGQDLIRTARNDQKNYESRRDPQG